MLNKSVNNYLLTIMILVASPYAVAREISYDYIQGTYISTSIDLGGSFGDLDGTGFGMSGSISISPSVAFIVGFSATEFDEFFGIVFDTTELTLGISSHKSIAPKTDISLTLAMFVADVEINDGFNTFSDDDTGNVIGFGFRHFAANDVELSMSFSRTDVFDDTSNTFGISARFLSNEGLSFGVGYAAGDDVDTLLFNMRIDI